jgi:hypothetical protein
MAQFQEMSGDAVTILDERLAREEAYSRSSHQHLWIAVTMFRVNGEKVFAQEAPTFDSETMLGIPQVGCYICEQPLSAEIVKRRCPGDPQA